MDKARYAMVQSRAAELIKTIEKWNVSVGEARDILSEAENYLYDNAWKALLKDITKREAREEG